MTKVFLVTHENYSDNHVKAVFSTKKIAAAYRREGKFDNIEEYELDGEAGYIVRVVYRWRIDAKTGEMAQGYGDEEMASPTERGTVTQHQPKNGNIFFVANSYESPEHARKLAVEARQAWLRENK